MQNAALSSNSRARTTGSRRMQVQPRWCSLAGAGGGGQPHPPGEIIPPTLMNERGRGDGRIAAPACLQEGRDAATAPTSAAPPLCPPTSGPGERWPFSALRVWNALCSSRECS